MEKSKLIKSFEVVGRDGAAYGSIGMVNGDSAELHNFKYVQFNEERVECDTYIELNGCDEKYLDMLASIINKYKVKIKIDLERDSSDVVIGAKIVVKNNDGDEFECTTNGVLTLVEKVDIIDDSYNVCTCAGCVLRVRINRDRYEMSAISMHRFGIWPVIGISGKLILAVLG